MSNPISLRTLEAEFYKYTGDKSLRPVLTLNEAQAIFFLCPLCYQKNNGSKGTHSVEVTFADRGVPENMGSHNKEGKATRWNVIGGSDIDDLELSPSIHIQTGCEWHGFVGMSGVPAGHAK